MSAGFTITDLRAGLKPGCPACQRGRIIPDDNEKKKSRWRCTNAGCSFRVVLDNNDYIKHFGT